MKAFLPAGIVISFLTACASPNYNYVPKVSELSDPPIDAVNVAYVGDPMLRQGTYSEHDAILLIKRTKVGVLGTYTFEPGYYTKRGEGRNGEFGFYLPSQYGQQGSVTRGALADPFQIIQAYHNEVKICGVSAFNGKACTANTEYKVTTQRAATADTFQQTLIYSGRIGGKINISYREFSGNIARPAFNNDVEYDIDKSPIVGYKGARLEIIEATNEFVKYRVISNFNKAKF